MVTRVRVEAEGSTIQEVEDALMAAFEALHVETVAQTRLVKMFGEPDRGRYPGLADAQAGEFVIERFARDCRDENGVAQPGHGAIVYRGRMTAHFARPSKTRKLGEREDATAYSATATSSGAGGTFHVGGSVPAAH